MRIGFLGLGRMGAPIAAAAMAAGYELVLWNRSPGKAVSFAPRARIATTPAEAADTDIVISMLSGDNAVEAVAFGDAGIVAGRAPIHISMSTIGIALTDRLDEAHRAQGTTLVSAPVFGRPDVARAAALTIVAAGAPDAIDTCRPIFSALARKLFVVGERPSAANLVKLCGNFMVASAIEAFAESITLAGKGGLSAGTLVDIMTGVLFPGPVYETYGRLMVERSFTPAGFAAPLGLKDVQLVAAAAEQLKTPMPSLAAVHGHLLSLLAQEGNDLDWAAILLPIERAAGVAHAS